jgi:hypothetical protein
VWTCAQSDLYGARSADEHFWTDAKSEYASGELIVVCPCNRRSMNYVKICIAPLEQAEIQGALRRHANGYSPELRA